MTRRLAWLWLAPVAMAHMVSMSTGEARIEGRRMRFELRMPLYEVAHVREPARALIEALKFSSRGEAGKRTESRCREISAEGAYRCEAVYEFPEPVERLAVESSLPSITVSNHVHLLRATRDRASDQAVLDFSFPRADLRFRPPTPAEAAIEQVIAGALRAAGGAAPLLFLASLVLAARGRRELLAIGGAFLLAEILSCTVAPYTGWRPAPRFVEAAAALTIAYLAVEILLLPQAGHRAIVVGVLGLFHGLYYSLFVTGSGYRAGWVLAGVTIADVALIGLLAWLLARVRRLAGSVPVVQALAGVLLAVGLAWFFVRLRS